MMSLSPSFARDFANLAHEHAGTRYDGGPYLVHLDAVVQVLRDFGHDAPEMLCAGYLHDVLEDTEIGFAALDALFGDTVSGLVEMVTDGDEPTRAAKKARTLARLRFASKAPRILKLADRIANVPLLVGEGC